MMKLKSTQLAFIFLSILSIISMTSCKTDDGGDPIDIYAGCCDIASIEVNFNPGKLFIPNAFTPNNDGVNDVFFVHADDGVEEILEFRIQRDANDIIHQKFSNSPTTFDYGWAPNKNNSSLYGGLFDYYVKVRTTDGSTHEVTGSICALICDELDPNDTYTNCGYSTQHNGLGGIDSMLSNWETECP